MKKQNIILTDNIKETIAHLQEDHNAAALDRVNFIDLLMTIILNGHPIHPTEPQDKLSMLQALNTIKQEYQSFIAYEYERTESEPRLSEGTCKGTE